MIKLPFSQQLLTATPTSRFCRFKSDVHYFPVALQPRRSATLCRPAPAFFCDVEMFEDRRIAAVHLQRDTG